MKLQPVFRDVAQSNHFIMRIFLQDLVLKYAQDKVMLIILIKPVYIPQEEFLIVQELIMLIEYLKAVFNYVLMELSQQIQRNIVNKLVLDPYLQIK